MKLHSKIVIAFVLLSVANQALSQKYVTSKSSVSFYSHAPMEDIRADNQKSSVLFNESASEVAFVIPIKEFQFDKALMQEHFNEKYLESDKYPRATFQGKFIGYDRNTTASQQVKAKGKLTIHGVTKEVEIPGKVSKQGQEILMTSTFIVKLEDYKIKIPQIVWQNIAEEVEVTLSFALKPGELNN